MYKIRALFNGRVRYNTLILGILPLLFLLETVLSPLSGEPITGFALSKIPTGFICLVLDFTGGTFFGFEWDLLTHSTITAISIAVYFLLLILFVLSCCFYLNEKKKIYCRLCISMYIIWTVMLLCLMIIMIYVLTVEYSDIMRIFVIIWSAVIIVYAMIKCIKNTKMIKEGIKNNHV